MQLKYEEEHEPALFLKDHHHHHKDNIFTLTNGHNFFLLFIFTLDIITWHFIITSSF